MKTNDIKSGMRIRMRDGTPAVMRDSKRGNTRMVEMDAGNTTDIGSVYAYDITHAEVDGQFVRVEHTKSQREVANMLAGLF